jgi:predicted O-methyltransferase YrrM
MTDLSETWHWAQQILATSRLKDHEGYEALAHLRMPGPDYYEALRHLHHALRPRKYVEIGVRDGSSLHCALPGTEIVAIDPAPRAEAWERCREHNVTLAVASSDDFFGDERQRARAYGFDLAFIDGNHDAEQVRRDFTNLETLAHPGSVILLHDVVPLNAQTSTPQCNTLFWTGDAWRVMAALVARDDLIAFTVACPPTGLGVVGRFTSYRFTSYRGLDRLPVGFLESDWDAVARRLRIVPNKASAIKRAFAGDYGPEVGE